MGLCYDSGVFRGHYSTFANKRRGVAKVLDGLRRTPLRTLDTVSKIWHPLSVGRWTLLPDPPSLPRHRAIFAFDPPAPSVGRMVRHPFALGSKVPKTEGPSQKCWTGCRDPPSHFGHTLKFRTLLPKVLDGASGPSFGGFTPLRRFCVVLPAPYDFVFHSYFLFVFRPGIKGPQACALAHRLMI